MPGLRRTDDKTFVASFQSMDRAILNPLFLTTFVGALVFTGLAMALSFGSASRSMLPWLIAAFVLYLAIVIVTGRINVPLNNALKAAGDPNVIDVAAARESFNEALWTRWNHVRSVACFLAFACLTWATVLYGRITT
jgi:uncharacterized membrane protein